MPLPPSSPTRQRRHHRQISVEAYARDDGLWELDAMVSDIKSRPTRSSTGERAAGEPIHDLHLRLVIDTRFNILAAGAESRSVPYPGVCDQHGDRYAQLVGLNLMKGFKWAVRERLGAAAGCTHLTELADVLPTAAVQAFAGDVFDTQGDGDQRPFQIDRCHALVADGAVVREHYPRWFRQPGANNLSQNRTPVTLAVQSSEPPPAEPRSSSSS